MSKLSLAEKHFEECKNNRIHYKDVPRYLEKKIQNEDEQVQEAIEIYVRYNLYDRSLTDNDIIYAKELLYDKK